MTWTFANDNRSYRVSEKLARLSARFIEAWNAQATVDTLQSRAALWASAHRLMLEIGPLPCYRDIAVEMARAA